MSKQAPTPTSHQWLQWNFVLTTVLACLFSAITLELKTAPLIQGQSCKETIHTAVFTPLTGIPAATQPHLIMSGNRPALDSIEDNFIASPYNVSLENYSFIFLSLFFTLQCFVHSSNCLTEIPNCWLSYSRLLHLLMLPIWRLSEDHISLLSYNIIFTLINVVPNNRIISPVIKNHVEKESSILSPRFKHIVRFCSLLSHQSWRWDGQCTLICSFKKKKGKLKSRTAVEFVPNRQQQFRPKMSLTAIFNLASVQRAGKSLLKGKATDLTYFNISDGQSSTRLLTHF